MATDQPAPDAFLPAAIDRFGSPLTGDQYVEHVLVARQSAWITDRQVSNAAKGVERGRIWAPLLPDFVLDADIDHVRPPEPPRRSPRSRRRYRPA